MTSKITKRGKRAQAAMEFLMTYGWAILVVLVVIGALAYFGVLNPSQLLPEKCNLPIGFNCKDFRVTSGQIKLDIENGAGRGVEINTITLTSDALTNGGPCRSTTPKTLANGAHTEFTASKVSCAHNPTGRAKNRYDIEIIYKWLDSPYNHTMNGELLARLEE